MEKKKNTKKIIIGIIAILLVTTAAIGTTVFLKEDDEVSAAQKEPMVERVNTSNSTALENNERENIISEEAITDTDKIELTDEQESDEAVSSNESENNVRESVEEQRTVTQNTRTNYTQREEDIETNIEETTVIVKNREVLENISWTPVTLATTNADMDIYREELSIEKKATSIIKDDDMNTVVELTDENRSLTRAGVGDIIFYTIKVSNRGNYKATNVVITDNLDVIFDLKEVKAGEKIAKIDTLEPGKQAVIKICYIVTTEDIDNETETLYSIAYATDGITKVEDDERTPINPDVEIKGNKVWEDEENFDGVRPESIVVKLLEDNEIIKEKTVTEDENWTYTFGNLPKYNSNNEEIVYKVSENSVDKYTTQIVGFNIINKHEPEKVDINVVSIWDDADDQDGIRPQNVKIELLPKIGNFPYEFIKISAIITEDMENTEENWSYVFKDLPAYFEGKKIEYILKVVNEDNRYTQRIEQTENGFEITNTYVPEVISIQLNNVWDDDNDRDGLRIPYEIALKNESGVLKTVSLNEEANYIFEDLPKYLKGKLINYELEETIIPNDYEGSITGTAITGFTVTNKHIPAKTKVSGINTWNDNDNIYEQRPESITVNLLANGITFMSTTTSEADGWAFTFDDIPLNDAGQPINYSIALDKIEGYNRTLSNKVNVTNTYNKPVGNVTKNWVEASVTDAPTPIDVVFILDTSLSMAWDNGTEQTRANEMIVSVNNAISDILRFNSNNRVSVVGFSEDGMHDGVYHYNESDASVLLPLGRYTSLSGKNYLVKELTDGDYSTEENANIYHVSTNVKYENGEDFIQNTRYFEQGTYTQAGIKLGAEQLINASDVTVNGVKRVPVIILISDGEPTAFSTNYSNPEINIQNNPDKLGTGKLSNTSAVYGYYTILTANYYKEQVKLHYSTAAKMFTMAMDVPTHYGRTVLNPNETNVNGCANKVENENEIKDKGISKALYQYINSTKDKNVTYADFDEEYNEATLSVTVIRNVYKSAGYYYADKAYVNKLNATALKTCMIEGIVETIPQKTKWKISSEEIDNAKVSLPELDTNKAFTLTAGTLSYTSCSAAINDEVVKQDEEGKYYINLCKIPAGTTITCNYTQK